MTEQLKITGDINWKTLSVFIFSALACVLVIGSIYDIRGKHVRESISEFGQLPSSSVQTMSLEFKGIVADYLFFKTLTYMGLKIGERKPLEPSEWHLIHLMLGRVSDLDGRFWDPYVFAEMMLAWQAGMLDETNQLLEKATTYRPEDYRPFYYMGFNHLFFKKNAVKAAPYLRKAAKFPRVPGFLKGLAARISLYANQTGIGIIFLEDLIKNTQDPGLANYLKKRLDVLKITFYLEQKVLAYHKNHGTLPPTLETLVETKLIPNIPKDPYGGKFYLLPNGRIYTTSKLLIPDKKKNPPRQSSKIASPENANGAR